MKSLSHALSKYNNNPNKKVINPIPMDNYMNKNITNEPYKNENIADSFWDNPNNKKK